MRPVLYFELTCPEHAMAVLEAIPNSWEMLVAQCRLPADVVQESNRLFIETKKHFQVYRGCLLEQARLQYHSTIEVCHSAYQDKWYLSPAKVHIELAPWFGSTCPEFGPQPARVRISWHQLITFAKDTNECHPIIDTEHSGTYRYVADIVKACIFHDMPELHPECEYRHPWQQISLPQAAE